MRRHHQRSVGTEHMNQSEDHGLGTAADPADRREGGMNDERHPGSNPETVKVGLEIVDRYQTVQAGHGFSIFVKMIYLL